jgi:hypothetical protein
MSSKRVFGLSRALIWDCRRRASSVWCLVRGLKLWCEEGTYGTLLSFLAGTYLVLVYGARGLTILRDARSLPIASLRGGRLGLGFRS